MRTYDLHFLLAEILYESAVNHNEAARPAMTILARMFEAFQSGRSGRELDSPSFIEEAIFDWLNSGGTRHEVNWNWRNEAQNLLESEGYRLCHFIQNQQEFYDACEWLESTEEK